MFLDTDWLARVLWPKIYSIFPKHLFLWNRVSFDSNFHCRKLTMLAVEKFTLLFLYFFLQGTGKRKRLNIWYSQHKKWSQIMSWHKNDKNNAVWYLSFLLNKIVNKRVSLSSIFLQCFFMKHWEMLAVIDSLQYTGLHLPSCRWGTPHCKHFSMFHDKTL